MSRRFTLVVKIPDCCLDRGAVYCDQFVCLCVYVCLSICSRAYLWNRWTELHEILCRSAGSVLLWRHCDTGAESGVYECLVGVVVVLVINEIIAGIMV